ncbi:DUF3103 family protein [Pseudoalteromonas xiamenensis]
MNALSTILFAGLAATTAANVNAEPVEQTLTVEQQSMSVFSQKQIMAKQLAKQLPQSAAHWQSAFSSYQLNVSVDELRAPSTLKQQLRSFNSLTRAMQGLNEDGQQLYQLRLVNGEMLAQWQQGETPLIAYAPQGDEKQWQYIEAFDSKGNVHLLDVYAQPNVPVLVLEVNAKQSLREGLAVMQAEFDKARGVTFAAKDQSISGTDAPISTSVINRIRLNDDQEPWILGDAEIYAVVNGVNPSRDEPVLDVVDMPYLDTDGRDYAPNQILIYWDRYRWQAADVLLMEHDDNTNYKTLATTLLDIVAAAMRAIPDPTVQGYALIPQLTNQLIKAMPDHWFSNDDDYVDVFYTLFEGRQYVGQMGASGNARMSLSPLTINPR